MIATFCGVSALFYRFVLFSAELFQISLRNDVLSTIPLFTVLPPLSSWNRSLSGDLGLHRTCDGPTTASDGHHRLL